MKNILILSENTIAKHLYNQALALGYNPIFICSDKNTKFDDIYPQEFVDFYAPVDEVLKELQLKFENISGIACCLEQLVYKSSIIAERLGVQTNELKAYLNLRDKREMKKCWEKTTVNIAKSVGTFSNLSDFEKIDASQLEFPLIIKPSYGAASAGVSKVFSIQEVKEKIKEIIRFNNTFLMREGATKSGFILEQYITGFEYSVDTIWIDGAPVLNGILSKGDPIGPLFPDRLYYIDKFLPFDLKTQLLEVSHEAVKAAGVVNGATHTEMRVMDGKAFVIESALRPGAGGEFYEMFSASTGVNYFYYYLISCIPECIYKMKIQNIDYIPAKNMFVYNVPYEGKGIIRTLGVDYDKLGRYREMVKEVDFKRKEGDYLPLERDSLTYLAWVRGEVTDAFMEKKQFSKLLSLINNSIKLRFV